MFEAGVDSTKICNVNMYNKTFYVFLEYVYIITNITSTTNLISLSNSIRQWILILLYKNWNIFCHVFQGINENYTHIHIQHIYVARSVYERGDKLMKNAILLCPLKL
jgi:hypothetical protein